MSFLLRAALAVLLLASTVQVAPAFAEESLPLISQVNVHRDDPVEFTKQGKHIAGSPAFAFRDGMTVRWFANEANCGDYVENPKAFPDVDTPARVAFFGADPTVRFPKGVYDPALGPVMPGDPAYAVMYHVHGEAVLYWFQTSEGQALFAANPEKYIPAIGGYCPGAMAADHVTPGDPRNAYYIPEIRIWGTFGSPNGPVAWAAMTPAERRKKYWIAVANYQRRTGLTTEHDNKVAAR